MSYKQYVIYTITFIIIIIIIINDFQLPATSNEQTLLKN